MLAQVGLFVMRISLGQLPPVEEVSRTRSDTGCCFHCFQARVVNPRVRRSSSKHIKNRTLNANAGVGSKADPSFGIESNRSIEETFLSRGNQVVNRRGRTQHPADLPNHHFW